MLRVRLLAAVCCLGIVPVAGAVPVTLHATYTITTLLGEVPPDWGSIASGDTVQAMFIWDSAAAVYIKDAQPGTYDPGPILDYSFHIGDATIFPFSGSSVYAFRPDHSAGVSLIDVTPQTAPSSHFIDELFINFNCADWTKVAGLPSSLSCSASPTGNFEFGFFEGGLYVIASLSSVTEVPEPGSLSLLALGLAAAAGMRRKASTTLRASEASGVAS